MVSEVTEGTVVQNVTSTNEELRLAVAYASKVEIDTAKIFVTVDAGVPLRMLIDRVEEAGLS